MSLKPSVRQKFANRQRLSRLHTLSIQTTEHLAKLLGASEAELLRFAVDPHAFRNGTFIDKKGKVRPKTEPLGRLKPILKRLNMLLQRLDLPVAVHGGRPGHSNLTNAVPHRFQDVVLKFDIKDFFPSISSQRVFDVFHKRCGCNPRIAKLLTELTTRDNQLAQGSPPSTIIAALAAERLIIRIERLVRLHGGTTTLFVDDIAISGPPELVNLELKIITIIAQEGFDSHPDKVVIKTCEEEQIVTGAAVNQRLDIPIGRMKAIRHGVKRLERIMKAGGLVAPAELGALIGQISYLASLNRGAAKSYRKRTYRLERYVSSFAQQPPTAAPNSPRPFKSGRPSPR